MARMKRRSAVLEAARQRLAGIKSISPIPVLGPNLNLDNYEQDILNLTENLNKYNETVTLLDTMGNNLDAEEKRLRETSRRVLAAIEAQFGPDSNQYEAAGGTRISDRKTPTSKPPTNNDTNT